MKLNPDCIRDILLSVEETVDSENIFKLYKSGNEHNRLKAYDSNELLYHFHQCDMAGLIVGFLDYGDGGTVFVNDLSPDGHQFLANIRQDTIWNSTKSIAAKVGSRSLDALTQIASNVITELIKAQFGLS